MLFPHVVLFLLHEQENQKYLSGGHFSIAFRRFAEYNSRTGIFLYLHRHSGTQFSGSRHCHFYLERSAGFFCSLQIYVIVQADFFYRLIESVGTYCYGLLFSVYLPPACYRNIYKSSQINADFTFFCHISFFSTYYKRKRRFSHAR